MRSDDRLYCRREQCVAVAPVALGAGVRREDRQVTLAEWMSASVATALAATPADLGA